MKILGLSGLPGLQKANNDINSRGNSRMSRICQGLDSAAAIVVDGKTICGIAEERLCGVKGTGEFPVNAIKKCMEMANIVSIEEFDWICHGFDYSSRKNSDELLRTYYSSDNMIQHIVQEFSVDIKSKFIAVPHHLAHAYSAIYCSNMHQGICIVADGMGEKESISVFKFSDDQIECIALYPISQSLGIFYSIYTKFLGFEFNMDEFKVMGMAAYGQDRYKDYFENRLTFEEGRFQTKIPKVKGVDPEYKQVISLISAEIGIDSVKNSDILSSVHFDIAHSLQKRFQVVLTQLVAYWLRETKESNLCLAGGVFLNCLANQKISELNLVHDLFIQPASGDDGTSLGAAIYGAQLKGDGIVQEKIFNPYLGPSYNVKEMIEELAWKYNIDYEQHEHTSLAAAQKIADGKVIAWFSGRMEFGPRALGARSILANPMNRDIKEKINHSVKFREAFRPFAPALLLEDAKKLFEFKSTQATNYMLQTATAKSYTADLIPGVVHEDGTARIQIVNPGLHKNFHQLLTDFKKLTGIGCVLNTSLNLKGQPLICDPETAVKTFLISDIDCLFLEDFSLTKKRIS